MNEYRVQTIDRKTGAEGFVTRTAKTKADAYTQAVSEGFIVGKVEYLKPKKPATHGGVVASRLVIVAGVVWMGLTLVYQPTVTESTGRFDWQTMTIYHEGKMHNRQVSMMGAGVTVLGGVIGLMGSLILQAESRKNR